MQGLYLVWWVQERHVSPAAAALILAIGDVAVAALEFPTGWVADRLGHRRSLIAGSVVQVAGMLVCWLAPGVPALVAACLLVALGDALRSGADQALLYRTCLALDREATFQRLHAHTRAVSSGAMVGLVLAGGAIATRWGFAAAWMAEVGMCTVGLLIAIAMVEPPALEGARAHSVGPAEAPPSEPADAGPPLPRVDAGRVAWRRVALLILPAAMLGALAGVATFLVQTSGVEDPARITTVVAAIALGEAAGGTVAARLPPIAWRGQMLLAALGVVVAVIAGAGPAGTLAAAAVTLSFLESVAHPLRAAAIQRLATDDSRARMASLASACDMVLSTIALPIAGMVRSARRP